MRRLFRSKLFLSCLAALIAVGVLVGVGFAMRDNGTASAEEPKSTTTTTTIPPTTTTVFTPPALIQPPNAGLPPVPPGGLHSGSSGPEVQAYEQRLADLKFDPGPVDGVYDQKTVYAVQSAQKVYDQPRDGVIGADTSLALSYFQYPLPLAPDAEANRAEIDVTKQVLTLYENYQVKLITTVSTGSGVRYCYLTPRVNPTSRVCEAANTPPGRFEFYEYRDGWDKSPLGQLYNPFYFNGGIAVHGYESVPTSPASHGCTRIPMHIADYFHDLVTVGEAIYVFGGTPAQVFSRTPYTAPPPTAPPPVIPPPVETVPPVTAAPTTAAPTTTP